MSATLAVPVVDRGVMALRPNRPLVAATNVVAASFSAMLALGDVLLSTAVHAAGCRRHGHERMAVGTVTMCPRCYKTETTGGWR